MATKRHIAEVLVEELGIPRSQAVSVLQGIFDAIAKILIEDGRIELRNFGVFEVRRRKARMARNPRTGEKVMVPEKRAVTLKPGREVAERVMEARRTTAAGEPSTAEEATT